MFGKKVAIFTPILLFFAVGGLFYFFTSNNQEKIVAENTRVDKIIALNNQSETVNKDDSEQKTTDDKQKTKKMDKPQKIINKGNVVAEKKQKEYKRKSKVANKAGKIIIKDRLVSWGFTEANGRKIDTIILHSSYDAMGNNPYSVSGLISEYKQYGVSPHYLIDRKGNIYRLVEDKNIAWHAGVSKVPDGRANVNNFSIGIEIMNTKTDDYTKQQYQATQNLIDYLKKEYKIKYVLGHNDIASGRKTDPWNFEWSKIDK